MRCLCTSGQEHTESSATKASVRPFIDVTVAVLATKGSAKKVIRLKTQYNASSFLLMLRSGFITHVGSRASAMCTSAAAEYPWPCTGEWPENKRSSCAGSSAARWEVGTSHLCCSCYEIRRHFRATLTEDDLIAVEGPCYSMQQPHAQAALEVLSARCISGLGQCSGQAMEPVLWRARTHVLQWDDVKGYGVEVSSQLRFQLPPSQRGSTGSRPQDCRLIYVNDVNLA